MNIFEKLIFPKLQWIQLEISGLCNANCFYCPHTIYKNRWKGRNFTFQEFTKLLPYLKKVKLLYLQGWGEPFCNPEIFNILKMAKEKECLVGTTTNGMILEDSDLEKIIDSKLDIIAFSLTGIGKNDILREGTKIEKIFHVIKELNARKIKRKVSYPTINIAYMLLKSNLEELEEIPYVFSNLGINDIIVSSLDFVPEKTLLLESVVPKNEEEYNALKNRFLKITSLGKQKNLNIYFNLPHPHKRTKMCSERPVESLFINSLGYVSPCVFRGIPRQTDANIFFGNINEKSLIKIWQNREYKYFRKAFQSGTTPVQCEGCNKLRILRIKSEN
ncbi:MAG: radical SAM protein [Thermodesulfovibrio sp.]|nr:radical SAM protein [Thermodesulfovibrio sp.]